MPNKSPFSKQFLKKQEGKLLKEKEGIEKNLFAFAKKDPNIKGNYEAKFPQLSDDSDETAYEVTMYGSNVSLEHNLESRLQKIKKALQDIKRETYGKCSNCKGYISEKRLRAYPEADICLKCKK